MQFGQKVTLQLVMRHVPTTKAVRWQIVFKKLATLFVKMYLTMILKPALCGDATFQEYAYRSATGRGTVTHNIELNRRVVGANPTGGPTGLPSLYV